MSEPTRHLDPSTSQDAEPPAERQQEISNPAEMIRLMSMFQALMVEVRDIELDEPGRKRLIDVHQSAVGALKELLSGDLEQELEDLGLPIEGNDATGPELRIVQSQLVGWLNGVLQGIQAAAMMQQAEAGQRPARGPQGLPELTETPGSGQYL